VGENNKLKFLRMKPKRVYESSPFFMSTFQTTLVQSKGEISSLKMTNLIWEVKKHICACPKLRVASIQPEDFEN